MSSRIYLDYAATTPVDPSVWEVFSEISLKYWANPSGTHLPAQYSRAKLDQSRLRIADLIYAAQNEIVFTSTATEANNLAIKGVIQAQLEHAKFKSSGPEQVKELPKPQVIVLPVEHECVLEAAASFGTTIELQLAPIDSFGMVNVERLMQLITPFTVLISIMLVNNEIGTIQPVSIIGARLVSLNQDRVIQGLPAVILHTDAVQAPLFQAINVQEVGCDLLTLSGHKIYSPRGAAVLFVKQGTPLVAQIVGGGQESGLRSGTPNTAAIVALASALELCQLRRESDKSNITALRDHLIQSLQTLNSQPGNLYGRIRINGPDGGYRIANNVNFSVLDFDHQTLLTGFDLAGITVAGGSSCNSGVAEISHVIRAIYSDRQGDSEATVRVSLGRETKQFELDELLECLVRLTKVTLDKDCPNNQ